MFIQIWSLPILLIITASLIAFPLSRYMMWLMEGNYKPLSFFGWVEKHLNSGPQNWKQYVSSLLIFNTVLFVFGYLVLALQPFLPLNPDGKGLLSPAAIFNSVISFMTNTNLQHYSGEQHLSNFSQIFFCIANMFLSAAIGLCALTAIIRALRSDKQLGNFFVDMWRVVIYMFIPAAFIFAIIFLM